MENKKCFVIIGYGKKPSYANGKHRQLDLDQTFTILIKPVFDALKIECYRAIDKNLSGSIDELMLQEIKDAELVITDLTTLNANVMWELGVRHALKPRHTILICEKEQMGNIPFDISSFVVHQYTHSEEGIPYTEVDRFRSYLTKVVEGVLQEDPAKDDSPVFTFLKDPTQTKAVRNTNDTHSDSFASLMEKAEDNKNQKKFETALALLAEAKRFALANMTLRSNLPLIVCRQALCTYKLEQPNKLEAFIKAKGILDELNPENSQDLETLGLSGAIHKRLFELTGDETYLDSAIGFYERGFQLKQDYYNGINAVFMLYKKASMLKSQNKPWSELKLKADYIRNTVLNICLNLEKEDNESETADSIWVILTIAEAYNYQENQSQLEAYELKAAKIAAAKKDTFALSSYEEQKAKIKPILEILAPMK